MTEKNGTTVLAPRVETGALAARDAQLIVHPDQLFKKIQEWQSLGYHVIGPAVRVAAFAEGYAVNAAVVLIDTKIDEQTGVGPEVYYSQLFHKPNERSLGKIALRKIGQGAGIDWITAESGRTSDAGMQHYWEYRAVGAYRAYDGTIQRVIGTSEVDLRDGSPQLRGMSEKQVAQARRFGLALSESKATNRATRELGLKSKYTVEELKRPFVALRVSYIPDMSDPEVKRMVTAHALGGVSALYPGRTPALALGPGTEEFVPLERPVAPAAGSAPPAARPTNAAAAPAPPTASDPLNDIPDLTPAAQPEVLPAKKLYRLLEAGKFSENQQTVYGFKSDQTGDEWLKTLDPALAREAAKATKSGTLLDLDLERKATGLYIVSLQPAQGELKL